MEQGGGEGVQGAHGGLVEVRGSLPAAAALLIAAAVIAGCPLQLLADAVPQFRGGGLGEGDGRQAVQGGPARGHQVHHPVDQAGRLAGACAGLHEQSLVQALADRATRIDVRRLEFRSSGHWGLNSRHWPSSSFTTDRDR